MAVGLALARVGGGCFAVRGPLGRSAIDAGPKNRSSVEGASCRDVKDRAESGTAGRTSPPIVAHGAFAPRGSATGTTAVRERTLFRIAPARRETAAIERSAAERS